MPKWVRSSEGFIAGICQGVGEVLGISPWLIRFFWLIAVLGFGSGIFLYLLLWYSLPKASAPPKKTQKKILGVCYRLSKKLGIEVGLVRFLTLLCFFSSFGVVFFLYIILNFTLEDSQIN